MSSTRLSLPVYNETSAVATYMQAKFQQVVYSMSLFSGRPEVFIAHPTEWSLYFTIEVDLAVDVISRAFHNQGGLFVDSSDETKIIY